MLASIAEFETSIRAERQADGITKAKAKLTPEQVTELQQRRASGEKIKDLTNTMVYLKRPYTDF